MLPGRFCFYTPLAGETGIRKRQRAGKVEMQ
jgi:hypothetical protein